MRYLILGRMIDFWQPENRGLKMQAQISLDEKDVVIRFPTSVMSQDALAHFLGYFELTMINQDSQLKQQQADELAQKIDRNVWQSLRGKMLK
jgi:hypothetical protein